MLIIHVPLLIALVTGDLVSGEGAMGTIRLLLTKPISRTKILFSKYLAGCAYTLVILLWMAFLALIVGKWLFGSGDLMVLNSDGLIILKESDLPWRFLCGFGIAYLSMDLPVLQKVQPFLFTNHMVSWRNFFEDPLPKDKILESASILLVHIVGLLSIAVYKFNRKDILS